MCSNNKKCKVLCVIPEDEFKKPFEYGWKREFVKKRASVTNSIKDCGEVYYISPSGTRCRSKKDIASHLHSGLDINMFTYARRALGFKGETVKTATAKGYKPIDRSRYEEVATAINDAENEKVEVIVLNNHDRDQDITTRTCNTAGDSNLAKQSISMEQILRRRILNIQNNSIPET